MHLLTPVPIPSQGTFEVVGESHHQQGIAAMRSSGEPVTALLVAETGNPYDPTAVRVLLSNGKRAENAGYLPRDIAAQWWPSLADMGRNGTIAAGQARFVGGTPQKPSHGVWVDVVDQPALRNPLQVPVAYTGTVARTTAAAPQQQVVYLQQKKQTNHAFHLVMSILTIGLWIPVWIIVAIANS